MIPRVIHRIWLGGEEPEWTRPFAATWDLPGWEVKQWGEEEIESLFPLVNQCVWEDASFIAPGSEGQLKSDLLRYEILLRHGGVYVDHDVECLKDITPLIEGTECFLSWEIQEKWATNCLMGSTPGHPFLQLLVNGIKDQVRSTAGKGYRPNRITGPHYLTSKYRDFDPDLVVVLPQELIFPYNWDEIASNRLGDDWGDAYTVHHWHNMRRKKGVAPCR